MAYTPENNPYIPGDPYSYDLKWQVDHINMLQGRVDDLDNAIQEATDEADRSEREADRSKDEADRAEQKANMSSDYSDYSYRQGLKSEGYATGQQNGENVDPGSPYYENNSKYYSQQAANSEQAAADYAAHIADPVSGLVTTWLADNITQPTTPAIDASLTVGGAGADAAVTGLQLVFNNLFSKYSDNTSGGYIALNGASFTTSATLISSALIPVTPGHEYTALHTGYFINWYDANGDFLTATPAASFVTTAFAPTGAAYARFIIEVADIDQEYVIDLTDHYTYPTVAERSVSAFGKIAGIDNNSVWFINLFDRAGRNFIGTYWNASDAEVTNKNYFSTDYLPITAGHRYLITEKGFLINYYDASKTLLTSITGTASLYNSLIPPTGAAYVKIIGSVVNYHSFAIIDLDDPQNGYDKLHSIVNRLTGTQNQIGKKGVAFGTSITSRANTAVGYLTSVAARSGIAFDNQGIGSATIVSGILNAITNYSGYADKNICIIEGFVNDWYTSVPLGSFTDTGTTTACGCLYNAITHILGQNEDLQILVVFDHYGQAYGGGNESSTHVINGYTQAEYYDEMAKLCKRYGIKCVKLYEESGISQLTPSFFVDDIHPNTYGANREGGIIWSYIKNMII